MYPLLLVKIGDFGLAKTQEEKTSHIETLQNEIGVTLYAAPEQMQPDKVWYNLLYI